MTRKLTFSGLMVALGVVLPQLVHLILGPTGGSFILPMHFPVFVAAFLLGPGTAALISLVMLTISFFLTGMPPVPILYFMAAELPIYALVAGTLYQRLHVPLPGSLLLAMLAGRGAMALAAYALQYTLQLHLSPGVYVAGALTKGLVGALLQLLVIPVLMKLLEKEEIVHGRVRTN